MLVGEEESMPRLAAPVLATILFPSAPITLAGAAEENVRRQLASVRARSEPLRRTVAEGLFGTAGTAGDLASGRLEWLVP